MAPRFDGFCLLPHLNFGRIEDTEGDGCATGHKRMSDTEQPSYLLWGLLLGASLGFMEGVISVSLWVHFGMPAFLVRPHQVAGHVGLLTVGGGVFGLLYGAFVRGISARRKATINPFSLYLKIMLLGALVYITNYWLILNRPLLIPYSFLIPDALLFPAGLAIAYVGILRAQRRKREKEITAPPAECG